MFIYIWWTHRLIYTTFPVTYKVFHGLSHCFAGPSTSYEQRSFCVFQIFGSTLFDCTLSTVCFWTSDKRESTKNPKEGKNDTQLSDIKENEGQIQREKYEKISILHDSSSRHLESSTSGRAGDWATN